MFPWDDQELLVTTVDQQRVIGSAAKLWDFLLSIQHDLYAEEQAPGLPTWAHPPRRCVNGEVIEGQPR